MSSFSSVARGTFSDDPQEMVEKEKNSQRWVPTSDVAERFAYFLALCQTEKAQFERETGHYAQKLTQWFSTKDDRKPLIPGGQVMLDIHVFARKHGVESVTYDWLNFGLGDEPRRVERAPSADGSNIVALDIAAPPYDTTKFFRLFWLEGFSREPTQFVDIPLILLREHLKLRGPSLRGLVHASDNMRGEIEKGDIAFVDTADNEVGDGIYAYKIGGIPKISNIQVRGKGILRLQGTKSYEDSIELAGSELDDLEIGGRVIGRTGSKEF
jgi:hypothetical protein